MPGVTEKPLKKPTNVSIREDLLREARAAGINLSQTLETALRESLRHAKEQQWKTEHADFVDAYNRVIAAEGLPLDEWRSF